MRSDNRAWIERLDFVERRDPLPSRLRIRLGKIEVNVIVCGIAGNHEPDRRDIQTGRLIRVGMAEFHGDVFWRITFTTLGVATALAFGNRSRRVPTPNQ